MHRFSCKAFKKRNDFAAHDGLIGEVRERFRDEVVLTESSLSGVCEEPPALRQFRGGRRVLAAAGLGSLKNRFHSLSCPPQEYLSFPFFQRATK